MPTSEKHNNFVTEPMGEKPVTEIPGVGEILGRRLAAGGFDKAYCVVQQYLLFKRNEELFIKWIQDDFNATSEEASDCYQCCHDWYEDYLTI